MGRHARSEAACSLELIYQSFIVDERYSGEKSSYVLLDRSLLLPLNHLHSDRSRSISIECRLPVQTLPFTLQIPLGSELEAQNSSTGPENAHYIRECKRHVTPPPNLTSSNILELPIHEHKTRRQLTAAHGAAPTRGSLGSPLLG